MQKKYSRKQICEALRYWKRLLEEKESASDVDAEKIIDTMSKSVAGDAEAAKTMDLLKKIAQDSDGLDEGTKRTLVLTGIMVALAGILGVKSVLSQAEKQMPQQSTVNITQIVNYKQVNVLLQQAAQEAKESGNTNLQKAVDDTHMQMLKLMKSKLRKPLRKPSSSTRVWGGAEADEDAFEESMKPFRRTRRV